MTLYNAGVLLDLLVGACVDPDISGSFDVNAAPNPGAAIAGPPMYWRGVIPWYLWQVPRPGHRTYCGFTTPNYSGDLELARAAADSLGVEYDPGDGAAGVCSKILDARWQDWFDELDLSEIE